MRHAIERVWLRHMDDTTRAVAHATIGRIGNAIRGGRFRARGDMYGRTLELAVRRRAGWKDATSSA